MQPPAQHVGQSASHVVANLLVVVPRAEVAGDDPLVMKPIAPLDEVVQVHVAVLVNLFLAVAGRDERHLRNQHLRLVHDRRVIESGRRAVAQVRYQRSPFFPRHLDAREPQVANLVARSAGELILQFALPLPHHVTQRRHGVMRGRGRHHQLARQLDLVAVPHRNQRARHPPAIDATHHPQEPRHALDRVLGQIDGRRLHLHQPPPRDVDGQGGHVVQVRVRNEEHARAHEVPRLGAQVEAELQLRDSPVRLHRGAGVALNRELLVNELKDGNVFDHRLPPAEGSIALASIALGGWPV